MQLYKKSIEIILANQSSNGAYVASPNFSQYRYCWFRDGSFIAYAMDLVGEHESASRFHAWASSTILRHEHKALRCLEKAQNGLPVGEGDCLHTRYALDGEEGEDSWPNFQLDGFGTWLWSLSEHIRFAWARSVPPECAKAANLVAGYLSTLWQRPNYSCWEEEGDKIHVSTLASIYGGLASAIASSLINDGADTVGEIRRFVLEQGVRDGHLIRYIGSDQVDASLLGVSTPYRLLEPQEPLMSKTVAQIEAALRRGRGGVHRYAQDTYYGGGEWVLLTAWLGWHYSEIGEEVRAHELLHWVEAQADVSGDLPEQVPAHLLAPDRYAEWEARWGPVAKPLLWSHAMYLILRRALESIGRR
ncbi:MAG: glycoside hydrolase family 15 protein [Chloroflexota bacterium]